MNDFKINDVVEYCPVDYPNSEFFGMQCIITNITGYKYIKVRTLEKRFNLPIGHTFSADPKNFQIAMPTIEIPSLNSILTEIKWQDNLR